jgi:tripartite-type tricarboxylate transporter receptor subunit TctC
MQFRSKEESVGSADQLNIEKSLIIRTHWNYFKNDAKSKFTLRRHPMNHRRLLAKLALALLTAVPFAAFAAYPEKPIKLIVPSAPGGAPDVLMRVLAARLSTQMGVSIIVENKPGGSYVIGTMEIVRAAPDGYTIGYGNVVSLATNRSLLSKVPYDIDKDLTLVSNVATLVNILAVNNDLPVKNVSELIAYAKKNPGKLSMASSGNGTTSHLGGELLKTMTNTEILHVPYKAATGGVNDLISGQIQVYMENSTVLGPHVRSGRVRALGISGSKRLNNYPEVPTVSEAGVPGFESVAWGGIMGPAGMPREIVERLNAEIRAALASPEVRERFKALDADPTPSSPEEFRDLSRRETEKWARVVKASGAKVD